MYASIAKRAGLFGARNAMQPPYGTPPIRDPQQGMGAPMSAPGLGMAEPQRKPGLGTRLFGQGWEDKAFALGGLMQGDQTGMIMMRKRQDQQLQQAAEAAAAQRKRAEDFADWQAREKWKRDNPEPVNNDTVNDFEWYKGLSDADREIYHRMKPQYMTVDNGDGTKSIIPIGPNGPVLGGTQGKPYNPDEWEDVEGGAASNGSGGFREAFQDYQW